MSTCNTSNFLNVSSHFEITLKKSLSMQRHNDKLVALNLRKLFLDEIFIMATKNGFYFLVNNKIIIKYDKTKQKQNRLNRDGVSILRYV